MTMRPRAFIWPFALILLLGLVEPRPDAGYRIQADVRYGPHPENVVDVIQPTQTSVLQRVGVIVIHGGGWVQGNKSDMFALYCVPLLQHGMVVANVEYRLTYSAPAPAAVNDVLQAAQWFQNHAADYNVDPHRIIALGYSAGGLLALMTAMAPASASLGPRTQLAAVVDFSGISDVADQIFGPRPQPYARAWVPEQANRTGMAKRVSPITYVRPGLPPILVVHGDADPLVPYQQSIDLVDQLRNAGDDSQLITVHDGKHLLTRRQLGRLWPQIFAWLKERGDSSPILEHGGQFVSRLATTSVKSSAGGEPTVNSSTF